MDELLVWRSYEKPPGVYKDIIPRSQALLKLIKADIKNFPEVN